MQPDAVNELPGDDGFLAGGSLSEVDFFRGDLSAVRFFVLLQQLLTLLVETVDLRAYVGDGDAAAFGKCVYQALDALVNRPGFGRSYPDPGARCWFHWN